MNAHIDCIPSLKRFLFSGILFNLLMSTFILQAQQPAFLTNGLVAFYPFSGNANDRSGNGKDAVVKGARLTKDRFGATNSAYSFNGKDTWIESVTPVLATDSAVTFSFWANTASWDSMDIVGIADAAGDNQSDIRVMLNYFQLGQKGVSFKSANHFATYPTNLSDGRWHHYAVVLGNGNSTCYCSTKAYVDGAPVGIGQTFNWDSWNYSVLKTANLTIGKALTSGAFFNGALDDLRIYNRDLSAAEVRALFEMESVAPPNSPRGATAVAQVVNGFVVGATITDGGSGYTTVPKVIVSGGGGSGATAVATIDSNGSVTSIKLLTSGAGYTGTPTISIDPPPFPPSQAKGTSTLINGFVTGVTITDTGHGYEGVIPPVTFLGGGGSGANGTAIVSNGLVTGISMTSSGTGYTNAPYVLIAAPPGLPTSTIEVSQVRVNLSLIPGYTYKIQTSTDGGNTWVDIESGILAVDKTLVKIFDVTSNAQLFRVVQVN